MSSDIDEFLDEVDRWKFKAHEQLKKLTAKQRQAVWARIGRKARAMGLHVIEPEKPPKRAYGPRCSRSGARNWQSFRRRGLAANRLSDRCPTWARRPPLAECSMAPSA